MAPSHYFFYLFIHLFNYLDNVVVMTIVNIPSRNIQRLFEDVACPEDLRHREQIQSPEGNEVRGGIKHAICRPCWHVSHNNMVNALFISPQIKHGRPLGTTANSGCKIPSMGR